jgi:PAS domain S-box-containing protein
MKLSVLNLEDEKNYSELILAELERHWPGLKFVRVETAEEFASAIENQKFDLILADYRLPSFDGLTALEMAKERLAETPVVFVTGTMGEELTAEALKKGAADVVLKDRLSRLVPVVKRALDDADAHRKLKEAESALRESEERFRAVVETATDAIICLKEPDTAYFWNKKASEMFGYSADEVKDKRMHDLIAPERYRPMAREGMKAFFETGAVKMAGRTIEVEGIRKDGTEFPMELSVSAMKINGKWHATGIIRDITARKKAEEETKAHVEELERFMKATIQREDRVKELRDEVKALKAQLAEADNRK